MKYVRRGGGGGKKKKNYVRLAILLKFPGAADPAKIQDTKIFFRLWRGMLYVFLY